MKDAGAENKFTEDISQWPRFQYFAVEFNLKVRKNENKLPCTVQ